MPDGPGPHAADAIDGNSQDVAGRRIIHWRELNTRTEVGLGEALKKLRRLPLGDAGPAVHDKVVGEAQTGCAGEYTFESSANAVAVGSESGRPIATGLFGDTSAERGVATGSDHEPPQSDR